MKPIAKKSTLARYAIHLIKHPILPIIAVVWLLWATAMAIGDHWFLFAERYAMAITMALGSFVAGATSEGGGAVAFPVMTLIFSISPAVARDFSLMIQSVGMVAASIAILRMAIPVSRPAIIWSGLGGALGIIVTLTFFDGRLPAPFLKILFTSLWLSFALALWWINNDKNNFVVSAIGDQGSTRILLFGLGILGGAISGLIGNGLDILVFSVLVLGFRLSESIATPTSVVLMAGNALVGALWKASTVGLHPEAVSYWWVCVPIVVVGAPLGAWFMSRLQRSTVANILIAIILIQYLGALFIIPLTTSLVIFGVAVTTIGMGLFFVVAMFGLRRAKRAQGKVSGKIG